MKLTPEDDLHVAIYELSREPGPVSPATFGRICRALGLGYEALGKQLGLSVETVRQWRTGGKQKAWVRYALLGLLYEHQPRRSARR